MSDRLFVYGTLRPGDVRWPLLSPYVADEGVPDTAGGTVYDTGRGYPAAIFGGTGVIHGRTYLLVAATLDAALTVLDAEEHSVPGGYHRITIVTGAGFEAWAYRYGGGLQLSLIAGGDWLAR